MRPESVFKFAVISTAFWCNTALSCCQSTKTPSADAKGNAINTVLRYRLIRMAPPPNSPKEAACLAIPARRERRCRPLQVVAKSISLSHAKYQHLARATGADHTWRCIGGPVRKG